MKKLLKVSAVMAIIVGMILIIGGIWGIYFTHNNIVQEKIVTPADASIPNQSVRGPLTLKAQVDIIREHALKSTDGKTFAEMPRQIPVLDQNGNPVLDTDGQPVMETNTARDIWITVTALTTALNLGILTYVFSALIILFGLVSVWTGIIFCVLSRKNNTI